MSRTDYKKKIKPLIHKEAFKYFLLQKQGHSKLNEAKYSELETQPYICVHVATVQKLTLKSHIKLT